MHRIDPRRRGFNRGGLTGATPAERLEIAARAQMVLRERFQAGAPPRCDDRPGPRVGRVFHHPGPERET